MDKVKKYIDANKDRFISELFDLLRIPSISAQSEHRPDMTAVRRMAGRGAREGGRRPCRGISHRGQSGGLRREDGRSQGQDGIGLRSLRRDARRSARASGGPSRSSRSSATAVSGAAARTTTRASCGCTPRRSRRCAPTECLPCNVKFMLEGEEEIGSPSLYKFCEQNKKMLKADIILVSDTSMISMQTPSITCGLRGLGLHGGRGDGTRQGPAFGAVRRCGRQSRPTC